MFVLSEFFHALAWLVDYLLWLYMWIVIIRALISWVSPDPWNPVVQFLSRVTDPVLRPIRKRLPMTPIDFSPLILIVAIEFLRRFLVPVLATAARQLT
jgi:YggT family protein